MITIRAGTFALAPALTTGLSASGGTAPYTYSVIPSGAGGTINATSGLYSSPAVVSSDPKKLYDQICVTDDDGTKAYTKILVGTPLLLLCDIIQKEMGLADGQVYLWDQKIDIPTDSKLYIAIGVMGSKPFGNTFRAVSDAGMSGVQSVNMLDMISIDILSRGPEARDRRAEVILALGSMYAETQQETNCFYISNLSSRFVNLSEVDGAAIPYRFNITVNLQYFYRKTKAIEYFDDFAPVDVVVDL